MSPVSAIAGISFGGTNEPTSISVRPARASARIQAFFASVGIRCLAFCRPSRGPRSEEHTSELQSHVNLVCRLLLEKKKRTSHWQRPTRPLTTGGRHPTQRSPRTHIALYRPRPSPLAPCWRSSLASHPRRDLSPTRS